MSIFVDCFYNKFLMIWIFFLFFLHSLHAKPLQIDVKAPAAVLMDAETGAILYEKEGFRQIYPASATKVGIALYVLTEKKEFLDQLFTTSSESLKKRPANGDFSPWWWYREGTRIWLVEGEKMRLIDLLRGLLLISGNDAGNVIAEGLGGSPLKFMEQVNGYFKQIGCLHTQFVNPHGCHHEDHWTIPYDLCLMMKEAIKNETFCEIEKSVSYERPKTNKQKPLLMQPLSKLLDKKSHFYYPKAIAEKTGYHSFSQYVLVAAAENQGRTLIGCVAGCQENRDRYESMIKMFETAFQEKREIRPLFGENHLFSKKIEGGKKELHAFLKEELSISYYPSQEPQIRAFVLWHVPDFPIQKGASVGEIQIIDASGEVLKKGELYAKEAVEGKFFHCLKKKIAKLLKYNDPLL